MNDTAIRKPDVQDLSTQFAVRPLTSDDVEAVYRLCGGNPLYYRYHPPFVSRESILEDMSALPPGKSAADKAYIGFYKQDELVAVMDLIYDYPEDGVAFIGFFMMDAARQGTGIGTGIITECAAALQQNGCRKIRLAIDQGNPQSEAFWTKNHFAKTGETSPHGDSAYLLMERQTSGRSAPTEAPAPPP